MVKYMTNLQSLFNIQGQTVVITGGSGELGKPMAHALAQLGAQVAIVSLHAASSGKVAAAIQAEGGRALGIACDVLDKSALEQVLAQITAAFGPVDILINAASGNKPEATTSADRTFFDLDSHAAESVFALNFTGIFLSSQVFGPGIAQRGHGCIANGPSINTLRPLTLIPP